MHLPNGNLEEQVFTAEKFRKIENEQGVDAAVKYYDEAISKGKVFIKDVIADAFLQNTLLKPEEYSLIIRSI